VEVAGEDEKSRIQVNYDWTAIIGGDSGPEQRESNDRRWRTSYRSKELLGAERTSKVRSRRGSEIRKRRKGEEELHDGYQEVEGQ